MAVITFSNAPSFASPGRTTLANNPTLTIASLGGVNAPPSPGALYSIPDILLPNTTMSPLTVNLSASQIPLGTTVSVRVTPLVGVTSTATTTGLAGTLANSTPTANTVTIPVDQSFRVDAEATFTFLGWLDSPIKYAGEDVTTATVTASLGPSTGLGTGSSQVRYYTASGKEVPADAVAALGLPH